MIKFIQKLLYKIEGKNKAYVSAADQFLQAFDKTHPEPSDSQQKEINKHRDIFYRKTDSRIAW